MTTEIFKCDFCGAVFTEFETSGLLSSDDCTWDNCCPECHEWLCDSGNECDYEVNAYMVSIRGGERSYLFFATTRGKAKSECFNSDLANCGVRFTDLRARKATPDEILLATKPRT